MAAAATQNVAAAPAAANDAARPGSGGDPATAAGGAPLQTEGAPYSSPSPPSSHNNACAEAGRRGCPDARGTRGPAGGPHNNRRVPLGGPLGAP
ncbi:hypothetical protein Emag_005372 [Eimeria magna]